MEIALCVTSFICGAVFMLVMVVLLMEHYQDEDFEVKEQVERFDDSSCIFP